MPLQRTRSLELLDETPREDNWKAHGDANSADELDDVVKWDGRRVRRIAWKDHHHPEGAEHNTWRSHRHHNLNTQEHYALEPYNHNTDSTNVVPNEQWSEQRLKDVDNKSSDSSDGEDEPQVDRYTLVQSIDCNLIRQPTLNNSYCAISNRTPPDYENIATYKSNNVQYRVQQDENKTATHYPLHNHHITNYNVEEYRNFDGDPHNDSGYSTKIYGSSKGPSPAFSGMVIVSFLFVNNHLQLIVV